MSQTRLRDLAMISIENKRANTLNVSMLIKLFAATQTKKIIYRNN